MTLKRPRREPWTAGVLLVVVAGIVALNNSAPSGQQRLEADGFVIAVVESGSTRENLGVGDPVASAVERVLGPGWGLEPVGGGRFGIVASAGTTSESGAVALPRFSAGEAWERAHQLTQNPEIRYAEPTFNIDANHGEQDAPDRYCPPCEPEREKSSQCHDPIPDALLHPEWTHDKLHGANIREAWDKFKKFGVAPGQGVIVGHPDTGYRKHPEIWPRANATSGVFPEHGWDFIKDKGWSKDEEDSGPFDPLLKGFLKNPGHGTKTASVIVSPEGSGFPGESPRWVTGVAPGAVLVPMRVAEGVALMPDDLGQIKINVARLANAIRAAAGPNRDRVKRRADVISISLGGLPGTRDLAEALDFAEENGVIVIAAAGNKVPSRRVVFPAAFDPAFAVAASNFNNKPWPCSSKGRKVATTAPGESVWTANSREGQYCLHASDGTSFATATTAGIVALWLSYPDPPHQRMIEDLRNRKQLPAAFREVLKRAVRPVSWSREGYGSGIIDAAAVLETRVSVAAVTSEAGSASEWCPGNERSAFQAIEAIFGDTTDGPQRVQRLLGIPRICNAFDIADELAFWYSTSERVAGALNRISEPRSPSAQDFTNARRELLAEDISPRLRLMISKA